MLANLWAFLIQWAVTALSLWVASRVFKGVRFADTSSLVVSALLLGFVNAVLRPILVVLTLPLTLLSFGLFLLVLNALQIRPEERILRERFGDEWTRYAARVRRWM